jgi:hypothetical protein
MAVFRGRHWHLWAGFCLHLIMPATLVFSIRAFGSSIRIENACPELQSALERFIYPPIPRDDVPPSSHDVVLSIDGSAGSYRLAVNNVEAASTSDGAKLLLAVLKALDDAVIPRLQELKAIHAGAVVLEDRAILIPGSTHAGKSSMVAELLRRGAKLLSDEYALIDNEGRVHSYPRPLMLRDRRLQQSPVLPGELGSDFAGQPVPVKWILALEYKPETDWQVREVPQSEALMILLRNTPHAMAESPEMVDTFLCAVSSAKCFAGHRGDAVQGADQILQLIGAPA